MTAIEKKIVTTYIISEADFKAKLGIKGRIAGDIRRFWNETTGTHVHIVTEEDVRE